MLVKDFDPWIWFESFFITDNNFQKNLRCDGVINVRKSETWTFDHPVKYTSSISHHLKMCDTFVLYSWTQCLSSIGIWAFDACIIFSRPTVILISVKYVSHFMTLSSFTVIVPFIIICLFKYTCFFVSMFPLNVDFISFHFISFISHSIDPIQMWK